MIRSFLTVSPMNPAHADRNLLFGILALQMDFITRDQLVAAVEAGRTPTQIADQYGMNPRHVNDLVRELRREAGLPIRRRAQPRVDAAPILAAATQGLTVTEIAQTTGISEVTVRRKLREAGVRARDGRRSA